MAHPSAHSMDMDMDMGHSMAMSFNADTGTLSPALAVIDKVD